MSGDDRQGTASLEGLARGGFLKPHQPGGHSAPGEPPSNPPNQGSAGRRPGVAVSQDFITDRELNVLLGDLNVAREVKAAIPGDSHETRVELLLALCAVRLGYLVTYAERAAEREFAP